MEHYLYTSYRQYAVRYDLEHHRFDCFWGTKGRVLRDVEILGAFYLGECAFKPSDYKTVSGLVEAQMDAQRLRLVYDCGPEAQHTLILTLSIDRNGIHFHMAVGGHFDVRLAGHMDFGPEAFAVSLDRRSPDLRAALGPATALGDNALFDRRTDTALELSGVAETSLCYDWTTKDYVFSMTTGGDDVTRGFCVKVHEDVYKQKFNIPYAPVNKRTVFPTPPVGWMTWYAVQFDASEATVLANARFQKEHLSAYGATTLWVDWEWYHNDFSGTNRPGVDIFHPDPAKYPDGLEKVSAEIKALGLTPALWIGATNDPGENEFFQAHPETVIENRRAWCGRYFIDPTNPLVKKDYIPRVFRQILAWGYEALKWDCLPVSFDVWDRNHDKFFDPTISSDQAMHDLMKIARDAVGKDFYMLSCSGGTMRDIGVGIDLFDAARIGGDIFRWSEFVSQCVGRILKLYALHNVVFYCDPDNVVLREKYNTMEQARSRASLVGMLGLPYTLGDDLTKLPAERIDLIRRTIPAMDMHPMDIRENLCDGEKLIVNLAIATPYEQWNVLDVLNLKQADTVARISLREDVHLPDNESYLIFDFWNRRFLGITRTGFDIDLDACASRVLCIRKLINHPQILSTTRHLTQGALELRNVRYDEERMILAGESDVIAGDDYAIYFHVPKNLRPFREGNDTNFYEME
ncbi:MAG: alpha-galactosidase, partial [Clostridia bacterium]